ncbi:SCO6745 family protein [Demetria terragena]|uniref:SCO6745 family protein n=1 Tax=Demetria terragena TaxID=63959 RepID=UPI00036413AF|nr:hypothetical protein [Demetria terragena]
MTLPLQHDDGARKLARAAYETLEPLHVIAYFSPHLTEITKSAGLNWKAGYVGARGGPLGATPDAVVTSCFFNFSPAVISAGWDGAVAHGLSAVMELREQAVDKSVREALGASIDDPEIAKVAAGLRQIAQAQSYVGRPLASAWSSVAWPEQPHLALWHATSVLREWRGDAHIAVLTQAGLEPLEALVFHEATHPDPTVRKRGMGRAASMRTRGWSEDEWASTADRLATRGILTSADGKETLTAAGGELYDAIELATDDAAVWRDAEGATELLERVRPYVKKVIDAGILPGTGKN